MFKTNIRCIVDVPDTCAAQRFIARRTWATLPVWSRLAKPIYVNVCFCPVNIFEVLRRCKHARLGVHFCTDVLLSVEVSESAIVVLHRMGALLGETGRDHSVSDHSDASNPSAFEVRHLCHVPRIAKEFAVFGGERKTRN